MYISYNSKSYLCEAYGVKTTQKTILQCNVQTRTAHARVPILNEFHDGGTGCSFLLLSGIVREGLRKRNSSKRSSSFFGKFHKKKANCTNKYVRVVGINVDLILFDIRLLCVPIAIHIAVAPRLCRRTIQYFDTKLNPTTLPLLALSSINDIPSKRSLVEQSNMIILMVAICHSYA